MAMVDDGRAAGSVPAAARGARLDRSVPAWGEQSEVLRDGQAVVVVARWVLVLSGLALALWDPRVLNELRIQLGALLLLAAANFALHAQLLRHRPVLDTIVYLASAADLALISVLVISQGGARSDLYIFYFPALLALAVAFPLATAVTYAGLALAGYGLIYLASAAWSEATLQVLALRLLMLAAVAVCGLLYQQIEQRRHHEMEVAPDLTPAMAGGAWTSAAVGDEPPVA